ncbi:MAG: rod shape-determining protein MreD [Anaerolineaceae bacterium 4572_78]|nr:MAG: rod shape-determining protein MreD [Anaerolineaceae bacterium 4572_78]
MNRPYLIPVIFLIIATLQTALSPFLQFDKIHPDWIVVIVLAVSLLKPISETLIWAFWGGLILDMFSDTPFGMFMVSMLIMAYLANFWQGRIRNSFIFPIILTLPYTVLFNTTVLLLLQIFGYQVAWQETINRVIFPAGIFNLLIMVVVYPSMVMMQK